MEVLPSSVIAHIGSFLGDYKDRVKCLESTKVFVDITSAWTYHCCKYENNVKSLSRLQRLPQTLQYVKFIKPRLQKYTFEFKEITENYDWNMTDSWKIDVADALQDIETEIDINYVENDAMITRIMDMFALCRNVKFIVNGYFQGDEPCLAHSGIICLKMAIRDINTNNFNLALKHVTHIPHLDLFWRARHIPIDLSEVDVQKTKDLLVCLREYPAYSSVVCPGKMTFVYVPKNGCLHINVVEGLKKDMGFTGCGNRINTVLIITFERILYETWTAFIGLLSKDVLYRITISTPSDLWYVHELIKVGATNIQFNCNADHTWLVANFCRACFPEMKLKCKILCAGGYENDEHVDSNNATTFYAAMRPEVQKEWFPVFYGWQQSTRV